MICSPSTSNVTDRPHDATVEADNRHQPSSGPTENRPRASSQNALHIQERLYQTATKWILPPTSRVRKLSKAPQGGDDALVWDRTALLDFARRVGREATGAGYEFYVDYPRQVAVESRRTRIALPLREKV